MKKFLKNDWVIAIIFTLIISLATWAGKSYYDSYVNKEGKCLICGKPNKKIKR